ncbi:MAG: hypothetical protein M1818_005656 [Claussenomyces sp. TS43310]|nr:MAG: hypothetical protein M1818_005656 [Claussenomyces sp. TS43310]
MVSTAVNSGHVVTGPPKFFIIRIVQLIVSIVVLGLAAYTVYFFPSGLLNGGPALSIFTCIATKITVIYDLVAQYRAPSIYNYWAILGLDIFCACFWLISLGLTAARAADFYSFFNSGFCVDLTDGYCYGQGEFSAGLDSMAAVAGLGGLMFLLFVTSVAIFGLYVHRHRRAGGHCTPSRVGGGVAPQAYEPNATSFEPKYEMQAQQQVYPVQGAGVAAPYETNLHFPPQQYQHQQQQQQQQQQQSPYQQQPMAQQPTSASSFQPAPQTSPYLPPQQQYPTQAPDQQQVGTDGQSYSIA